MEQERLLSRKEMAQAWFAESQRLFRCPVCGKFLKMSGDGRLCCKKNHSFDVTQKGYVNFAAAGELPGYDKALFVNRRAIFSQGFYDPLAQAVAGLIREHTGDRSGEAVVLDAGCGEGFYTAFLSRQPELQGKLRLIGVDLCRDAIAMAPQYNVRAGWCVADLVQLPLAAQSVDILLDILTPANYREFGRLLKKDGILIKVIPARDYLAEIRDAVKAGLQQKEYSNQAVVDYSKEHIHLLKRQEVCYRRPVTPEQAAAFFRMTPLTGHIRPEGLPGGGIKQITIHMEILVGRIRQ